MGLKMSELKTMMMEVAEEVAKKHLPPPEQRNTTNDLISKMLEETAAQQQRETRPFRRKNNDDEPGIVAGRLVHCLAASRGVQRDAIQFALKTYGGDGNDPVVKALAAGSATAGGFIIPEQYSTDIIELLRPASVVRRMNPVVVNMDVAVMRWPVQTGGASASYIGENTNIPVSQPTFGQLELSWKKLAALVPISNDLIRRANPSADTIVRDDLVNAMAQREDQAFIRDDGTQNTPRGLRYWPAAANVLTATDAGASPTSTEIMHDLTRMIMVMRTANSRMVRLGWLMSPRTAAYIGDVENVNGDFIFREEMAAGRLRGYPVAISNQIPENIGGTGSELYLVDFNDVIIGQSVNLTIDSSAEAAYHDGSSVVSAYSLDQTIIRAIAEHDMIVRYAFSVVVLTPIAWGT